jgi:predicted XRE-type DNA-binding protein
MSESILTPASDNIFEDLGFPPEEAAYLIIRADLMLEIRRRIETQNWTIDQAAVQCHISRDRVKALLKGEIEEFTIDQLIEMLSYLGMVVRLEVGLIDRLM